MRHPLTALVVLAALAASPAAAVDAWGLAKKAGGATTGYEVQVRL